MGRKTDRGALPDFFLKGEHDKESFRLEDFPFVFHTVDDYENI